LEAYLLDWASLLTRWLHLITGVAWIGASFYFIWLDNSLKPPVDAALRDKGVAGELWAVHGGGFYNPQKYLVAPASLPAELHWFKWEAYTTWITGFLLLTWVYYFNASAYLVDRTVLELTPGIAIAISLGVLLAGWLVYDLLCRSPLGEHNAALAVVGYALVVAAAYGLGRTFGARAAYLHVGAMVGTMMAANVLTVIIPGQKRMVEAMRRGEAPNPADGKRGKQRSVHNNYLTLPVLFIMVSNHYPMTYRHQHGWAVLAVIILAAVLIRHFFNLRHKGKLAWGLPAAAGALLVGLVVALAPARPAVSATGAAAPSTSEVQALLGQRCQNCHADKPTFPGITAPPASVLFDDPRLVEANAQRIYTQVVQLRAMPLGNVTSMTDAERDVVARWFAALPQRTGK
jgi:uncharacterized membrane protein